VVYADATSSDTTAAKVTALAAILTLFDRRSCKASQEWTCLDMADDIVAEAGSGANDQERRQADQQTQHRAETDGHPCRRRHWVPMEPAHSCFARQG